MSRTLSRIVWILIGVSGTLIWVYVYTSKNISDSTNDIIGSGQTIQQLQSQIMKVVSWAQDWTVRILVTKQATFYNEDPNSTFGAGDISEEQVIVGGWSGIFVHKDGYILTNKHVVENAENTYTVMFADGTKYAVEHVRFDSSRDLAVLKIDISDIKEKNQIGNHVASFISSDDQVSVGEFVVAIGYTRDQDYTHSSIGIISSKDKSISLSDGTQYRDLYQTDAVISQGNSGWPLVNMKGEVVGVLTATATAIGEKWSFAIPVTQESVDTMLTSIIM